VIGKLMLVAVHIGNCFTWGTDASMQQQPVQISSGYSS